MKVAVATANGQVSAHFGHAEGFTFATVEKDGVTDVEYIDNPGGNCAVLPNLLASRGVQTAIVGGIGAGAVQNLQGHGIEVIGSVSGSVDAVLEAMRKGTIEHGAVGCDHHDHDHDCK